MPLPKLRLLVALAALTAGCARLAPVPQEPRAPAAVAPTPSPAPAAAPTTAPVSSPAAAPAAPASLLPADLLANLPPPLPPPEPPPDLTPPPAAVTQADPLDVLWGHRLEFGAGGQPLVIIRIMEGQEAIGLRSLGPARLVLRGGATLDLAAGARLTVRLRDGAPARLEHAPLLAEASTGDRRALDAVRRDWAARGVPVRSRMVGGVYGIAGRVVDNRRELLLADGDRTLAGAQALAADLMRRYGQRIPLHAEPVERPRGTLIVFGEERLLGEADRVLALEPSGDAGTAVEAVAHGLDGKAAREDRRYRGRLLVTVDAGGALAAVDALPLEALLRGLVPSEMPAGSPLEALKAQAVTARSNVLAQIGTRHLGDPYVLCAEVHCQAYRGTGAETARTDEAVRATAGEALFGRANRTLVDGVYSAMCGGHGEDAASVWGGPPDPSLRGLPDLPEEFGGLWAGGLREEPRLRAFLADPPDAFCRRPAAARRDRFRWERRFLPAELDQLTGSLGVGSVRALTVLERGVSGRALALRVEGTLGAADVRGELTIRRLLRNLPSSMFVVDHEGDEAVLRGGGWGHGAGMCQWGAIGRAEAGHGYRDILRAYFAGAEVARIY
jgi:SpoIID/LytB domain protein